MTISEILLKPKGLESENEALRAGIEMYSKLLPGSPVLDRMRADIEQNEEEINAIQSWIEGIPDEFIKAVIRQYQKCADWSQVCAATYGYPSYHTCRSAALRYLKKNGFEERFQ